MDRRQRVPHAMMQLLQQQTLQSFGDLVFCRINSRLSQEARRIDSGLRQQLAETRVFRFEGVFLETLVVTRHNHARVRTAFRYPTRNSRRIGGGRMQADA